jgi:hypothetical protein
MKAIKLLLLSTLSMSAFAQTISTTDLSLMQKLKKQGLGLSLESDTTTVLNRDNDEAGFATFMTAEPSIKLSKKTSLSGGIIYAYRTYEDSSDAFQNTDGLDESFLKLSYKALSTKDNSPIDMKLQARIYNMESKFFREAYSNDGNIQARAYIGFPIIGKLAMNKYTSYLRVKRYLVNQNAVGSRTREYELRARISPTYSLTDNVALASTFTYNHVFNTLKTDNEELLGSLSARFTPSRSYAVMLRAETKLQKSNSNGDLADVDNNDELVTYALTLNAYF